MGVPLIRKHLLAATAFALLFTVSHGFAHETKHETKHEATHEGHEDHDSNEAWRLFIADHTQAVVRAIDFIDGKELGVFATKGPASLTASGSGQIIYATQPDNDIVHIIQSGIKFSDHGDHRDLDLSDVKLSSVTFEGKRPFHVVPHGDHAILFYDRGGKADIIHEAALLENKADVRELDTLKPHHGVAVSMGRYILMSVPNTEIETKADALPPRVGLRILDENDKQIGDVEKCTDLHGEATSARLAAFGCKEGVLIAKPNGSDAPQLQMLAYPQEFPTGYTATLLGGKTMQFFLGNYGDDKLVLIDPEGDNPYRLVELPTRRVDFILDPVNPKNAYILTEDGYLHVLDVLKAEIVRSAKVTEPYSKDGHWRDPRPRLAVADGEIAITDPRHSLVRVIDPENLTETRTIAVEGMPFSIVAVGGSGASH